MAYRLSIPGQVSELQLRAIEAVATLVPAHGCVVEVGSLFGRSSWAWAKSVPQTATVVCVDPWSGNEGAHAVGAEGGVRYGFDAFARYTEDCPNIVPVRAFSPDGISWNRAIDCYYEDAVHTDPILSRNIDFWSKFLRPTGILCGDDYRPRFPDVRQTAERMAHQMGRELIVADFFWCLLPSERLLPNAASVAETLRQIGLEAEAKRVATPAIVRVTPLLPPPARIAANRPHCLALRVTNEGGQIWPKSAADDLALHVEISGGATGEARSLSIPVGREQLAPDEAILLDVMIEESDANGVVLEIDCSISNDGEAQDDAAWHHRIFVDEPTDAFATEQITTPETRPDTGWANSGDAVRWSIGFRSRLTIDVPAIAGDVPRFLNLCLRPYISSKQPWQRLIIEMDGQTAFVGCLSQRFGVSLPVAGGDLDKVTIDLRHPDAHRPVDSSETSLDRRTIGFALEAASWSAGRPAPMV